MSIYNDVHRAVVAYEEMGLRILQFIENTRLDIVAAGGLQKAKAQVMRRIGQIAEESTQHYSSIVDDFLRQSLRFDLETNGNLILHRYTIKLRTLDGHKAEMQITTTQPVTLKEGTEMLLFNINHYVTSWTYCPTTLDFIEFEKMVTENKVKIPRGRKQQ